MSRELKFRAWSKEGERMVYDPYFFELYHYSDENRINKQTYRFYEDWRDLEDGRSIDCELMQFTGLLDKNGKQIFEGDIVKWGFQGDQIGQIKWSNSHFGWEIRLVEVYKSPDGLRDFWSDRIEVIGNIYENADLLT